MSLIEYKQVSPTDATITIDGHLVTNCQRIVIEHKAAELPVITLDFLHVFSKGEEPELRVEARGAAVFNDVRLCALHGGPLTNTTRAINSMQTCAPRPCGSTWVRAWSPTC